MLNSSKIFRVFVLCEKPKTYAQDNSPLPSLSVLKKRSSFFRSAYWRKCRLIVKSISFSGQHPHLPKLYHNSRGNSRLKQVLNHLAIVLVFCSQLAEAGSYCSPRFSPIDSGCFGLQFSSHSCRG